MQWIGLAVLGLFLTGCVSQDKYNALKLELDQAKSALGTAQSNEAAARAEADALKKNLDTIGMGDAATKGLIANLTTQNQDYARQLAELQAKYEDAIRNPVRGAGPLPAPLANALQAFAAQNSDLVEFDAARGIVKFKSDVTFDSGSADLKPEGKAVIARFAQILNSPAAGEFELMVAGHTDNARVVNPDTKRRHPDNWYLSAHRAIAVGHELMVGSVQPSRLAVSGYADTKPVASNVADSGRKQNRRVEVMILPLRGGSMVATGAKAAPPKLLNKDSVPTVNKDTPVVQPKMPQLNK
jgi:chemotaxis protein MotB